MRVVVVTPTFFPATYWGGPTTAMHELCNALAMVPGLQMEVVTTDSAGPALSDKIRADSMPTRMAGAYDVYYCRRRFLASVSPSLLVTAWRLIRRADIVHLSATYSFPTLPVLAMARILSKPLVWTPHGAMIPWKDTRKRILKSLWNRVCGLLLERARSIIHVASEREAAGARSALGEADIRVIPFGISISAIERKRAARDRPLHLIYLGRLDPIKAVDNLLRALALPQARFATLSVCGTGTVEYEASLHALASHLGLDGRVRFEGHVEARAKEEQFARADVLVLPSHTENFGYVVAEALARGVPVIASKGTPWEGVERHGCGMWVDNSPEALADAINELPSMDLTGMGEGGKRWVTEWLSWPVIAAEMTAAYEGLLKLATVSRADATNSRQP